VLMRRAAVLFLIFVASCARGVGTGSDGRIEHPTGSDELVVRVEVTGGLLAPEAQFQTFPAVSILGDGRIFVSGPHIEIFPPPALFPPLVGKLEEKDLQAILTKAEESGMLEDRRIENDRVADSSTHVFLINARGRTYRTEAHGLFEAESEEAMEIRDFQEFLSKFSEEASEQWEPDRIQLLVFDPSTDAPPPDVEPNRIEWPLSSGPEEFGSPYEVEGLQGARCGVVEAGELSKLRDALEQATSITLWSSNAKDYRVAVLPLLPDQEGCLVQSP
jgi:hypothetical protein